MDFKNSKGMILGKFLPPHKGHQYLIEFGQNFVDELTVVVGTLKNEPISGELRYQWIKEMFPKVNVVHLTDENPQDPSEHPDFWNIWRESLNKILPYKPDYVFASEDYGHRLAQELEAKFIPVNKSRDIIQVSGTKIRENPFKYWHYIPDIVKPYFVKKICVLGQNSIEKLTLIENLANHYQTNFVPDYSKTYLDEKDNKLTDENLDFIIQGQLASEKALLKNANKIIFCESNIKERILGQNDYDLYLVIESDNGNDSLFNESEKQNYQCIKLSGDYQTKFETACQVIDKILR